jgi:hypothetical protein
VAQVSKDRYNQGVGKHKPSLPLRILLGTVVQVRSCERDDFERLAFVPGSVADILTSITLKPTLFLFSLGIISALLGTPTCKAGRMLLDQALRLFDRVQARLQPEPDSKHWSLLQLAVMNNRVCVLKDLSKDNEMLDGLVEIGLACSRAWKKLDSSDYDFFHWVAETHLLGNVAVAA